MSNTEQTRAPSGRARRRHARRATLAITSLLAACTLDGTAPRAGASTSGAPDAAPARAPTLSPDATAAVAAAPGVKGVQLVMLPYWPAASVTNFLDVFYDPKAKKHSRGPKSIEIGFLPFAYGDNPKPPTNFQNARTIIDKLRGGGKRVLVDVHLSFHAKGSASDAEIKRNAEDFAKNFLKQYAGKAVVSVVPSLEDYGSDADFKRWSGLVLDAIRRVDKKLPAKVALRRSVTADHGQGLEAPAGFRAVEIEYHGPVTGSGTAYSNDGNFVYFPGGKEDELSLLPTDRNPTPRYALADFISATAANTNRVLLWRPLYNVLVRSTDPKTGRVVFDRDKRNLGKPGPGFDEVEKTVLKQFLGM